MKTKTTKKSLISLFKRTPEKKNYKQKSFPDTQISELVVVVV